jgi:arylsulfatase A-like enzyme
MHSLSATRRAFLATLGVAASSFPAFGKKHASAVAPPNVLLILADDLPAGMLGCYGSTEFKTPNLDALARRGLHFQNALASSNASSTGRATTLSGRTPLQLGANSPDVSIGASEVLIMDVLAGAGYDVGYVGAWGLGADKQPGHGIRWSYILSGDTTFSNGEPVQDTGEVPANLTRRALQFLDQQKQGAKPFFLTIAFPGSLSSAVHAAKVSQVTATPATPLVIDKQVPPIIAKINERGLEDNTMIVFTSAGGSAESQRVPLIYCWPGRAPVESRPPELVGAYDLLPTICDAAGVSVPDRNLCGRSYLPVVLGKPFPKKQPWRPMVYGSFGSAETASDNRFKLILRDDGKGLNQLFDVPADPKQKTNLFGNRAFISSRDQLRHNLMEWKAKYSK